MAETQAFIVPVPEDTKTIAAIHDGNRWIQNILPGSVEIKPGHITFLVMWTAGKERRQTQRRFTLALDLVGGYQTNEG